MANANDEQAQNVFRSLEQGTKFPYDGGAHFCEDRSPTPTPTQDWAHAAARGVLADLQDRRGIKQALDDVNIDHETRAEITKTMAAIIRQAALTASAGKPTKRITQ